MSLMLVILLCRSISAKGIFYAVAQKDNDIVILLEKEGYTVIFYKNQKNRPYRRTFLDLFREFDLHSARGRWYLRLTLIVSSAMLIMSLLGLPRAMWAGIAFMSVCLPFTEGCKVRAGKRGR